MIKTLEAVANLNGIPGFETEVRNYLKKQLIDYVDLIEYDKLGSIITSYQNNSSTNIYLSAHLDEIGLMVTYIDEGGFLYFDQMGGFNPYNLYAMPITLVTSNNDSYHGCIYSDIEVKYNNELKLENLFVDIGCTSKEEVLQLGIDIGAQIIPYMPFTKMANQQFLMSKAFDDRVGVAAMIEVMKALKKEKLTCNVYGVGSVQEENGCRGAQTSSYKINPHLGIAIDVCNSFDNPSLRHKKYHTKLGAGPVLHYLDGGVVTNPKLMNLVKEIALENNIPFQIGASLMGATDMCKVSLVHQGVPTIYIGIAQRYMHSNVCIVHESDYLNTIKLVTKLIASLNETIINEITNFE
ncbi:MAG: M42 family metallopeptidase [Bacilli bacterium]